MPPRASPLWLTAPSRFAGVRAGTARVCLAVAAVLLALSWTALLSGGPPTVRHAASSRIDDEADVVLYENIVRGVAAGGNYYAVAADALRHGDYPLRPFITFRLPTLAVIEAALPVWATVALLYALVAGVCAAWAARLRAAFTRVPPSIIAMALLLAGLMAFVQSDLIAFHEIWAGLLIALSLALRRGDRWVEAVAFAMMAMLIRETAALYVGLMAGLAMLEGRRREALAWGGTIGVLAIVLALHAHAVSAVVHAADPVSPGWSGLLGYGFFVRTMAISTALAIVPLGIAAPLVALALFGWASWASATGLRVFVTLAAYAVLIALFARADTFYWGLMIAPTLLVGLAFVPDGLRDLVRVAAARPRITVTRVVR